MFWLRTVLMAFRSLRANLLRSLLATLGVIIGVGAVISAIAVLEGAREDFRERMASLGSNVITIYPKLARRGGRPIGTFQSLKASDIDALLAESQHISAILPEVQRVGQIKYFNKNCQVQIVGTNQDFQEVFNIDLLEGRFLEPVDIHSQSKVCVLGYQVARDLFGQGYAVDKAVKLGSTQTMGFRVVGVMQKKGQKGFRNMDELVLVPITTAQQRMFGIKHIDSITVQAAKDANLELLTDDVKRTLRRLHRIRAGDEDDFSILNPEEIRGQVKDFMKIWALVLYMISGISLVVGGIGIMNIMLVSVTERTREIGVRIAVGARGWDILKQFLIESSTISLIGGALGVLIGIVLSDLMSQWSQEFLQTRIPMWSVVVALVMAVVVGIVSGIYPAYKASRLDPVEALRYE